MAEGILKDLAKKDGLDLDVLSVGLEAPEGLPPAEYAEKAMAERDIDITKHKTHMITDGIVGASDLIITMTELHKAYILRNFENTEEKTLVLGGGISDPYGYGPETYRRTAEQIYSELKKLEEQGIFPFKTTENGSENNG